MAQASKQILAQRRAPANAVGRLILDFVSQVPPGRVPPSGDATARAVCDAMVAAYREAGISASGRVAEVDQQGARLLEDGQ